MSASSRPTRNPRSRSPSARLSAVVDFPTPPLPEATAMTAEMPGISDCFDIGEAGPGCAGARCAETCGTPCACRCGAGAGAAPALRSAVSAIIATVTPGIARTAASASARTLSQARASAASTLIEKNTFPSLTAMSDRTFALVKATPRGDATLDRRSRTCCCVTLNATLPAAACFQPDTLSEPAKKDTASNLFVGHFIVEFEHHAVGIGDENLPDRNTRHFANVEPQILGLEPLFHAGKPAAGKGDMVNDAGIGLLLLVR